MTGAPDIAQMMRAQRDRVVTIPRTWEGQSLQLHFRVQRVSMALTMQHGSANTLLISGVVTTLRRSEEQQRASRLEGELVQMQGELARRLEALPSLPEGERAAAEEVIAALRERIVATARKVADLKALALEATAKEVLRHKPGALAEQHAAIAAAGVVAWATTVEGQAGEPDWKPVRLTTIQAEEDPAQGVYHVSVLTQDELFKLSEAIYDHSVGGAGGRLALERFRHHPPGPGGAAVADERGPEPAPAPADPPLPLRPDPDLHLPRGGGDRADADDRAGQGVAGGDHLTEG